MHLHNRSHCSTANAFSPQLPQSREAGTAVFGPGNLQIPTACEIRADGGAVLRIHAPTAQSVRLMGFTGPQDFTRDKTGLWTLEVAHEGGGFRPLLLQIDGVDVLSPMLPVGYSSSRAINYLDLPRDGAPTECANVPHGAIAREFYWSDTTGNWESCVVYTPPGYHRSTEAYPVLYLQHGHGENEQCWAYQGKIHFIMDNLLAQGKVKPCLIVMNNGMVPSIEDGVFASRPWLFEPLLLQDCIPFIERSYRCKTDRLSRAIAGLSMGSMQASSISLHHPELFAWVGIFSGFVKKLPMLDSSPNDHLAALENTAAVKDAYRLFYRAIGETDPFGPIFREESEMLAGYGLSPAQWPAHREVIYHGSHEWNVWRDCAADFLPLLFQED